MSNSSVPHGIAVQYEIGSDQGDVRPKRETVEAAVSDNSDQPGANKVIRTVSTTTSVTNMTSPWTRRAQSEPLLSPNTRMLRNVRAFASCLVIDATAARLPIRP